MKPRLFSWAQPVPNEEEEYKTWMERAMQDVEEWDIPEAKGNN